MIRILVRVEHEVTKPHAQPTEETCYYISSLDLNEASAKEIAYYNKGALGNWEPPALAVRSNLSRGCLPCAKELFGMQSESHPQVLFSYSSPTAWRALAQGETLEMQPAHRLPQASTRILMREPCACLPDSTSIVLIPLYLYSSI